MARIVATRARQHRSRMLIMHDYDAALPSGLAGVGELRDGASHFEDVQIDCRIGTKYQQYGSMFLTHAPQHDTHSYLGRCSLGIAPLPPTTVCNFRVYFVGLSDFRAEVCRAADGRSSPATNVLGWARGSCTRNQHFCWGRLGSLRLTP